VSIAGSVADAVVAKGTDLVGGRRGDAETFLGAAVVGNGSDVDVGEVAEFAAGGRGLVILAVGFAPAVRGAGGIRWM